MSDAIDFEAEGLLDGLEGEERQSRLALLERLAADGSDLDELRSAIADGRLALLPLERMLSGRPRYTTVQVAERTGIPIEELERQWRSIGVAVPARDEVVMSAEDLGRGRPDARGPRRRPRPRAARRARSHDRGGDVAVRRGIPPGRRPDVRRRRRHRARGLRPRQGGRRRPDPDRRADPRLRLSPASARAAPPRRLRRGSARRHRREPSGRRHAGGRLRRSGRLHEARRAAPTRGARADHRPPRGACARGQPWARPAREADRRRGDVRLGRHRCAARLRSRARRADGRRGGGGRGRAAADPRRPRLRLRVHPRR